MPPKQTNTDRIVEAERDIDSLQVAVGKIETKLNLLMWMIPISISVVGIIVKLL